MYTVSDTLFARLEPFIKIARLELNAADSTALVGLRGIGPYYAQRILEYRSRLGGFVRIEQLLEIKGIDSERYEGLAESVCADSSKVSRFSLWSASPEQLASHPYIGTKTSRAIERFKSVYDTASWNIEGLVREHILSEDQVLRLTPYLEN